MFRAVVSSLWPAERELRAAVILPAEEEAVGPTVVETHWVLGKAVGAVGNARICLRGRRSIFLVVDDTTCKASGRRAERSKTLFVGKVKCHFHVGNCVVNCWHFSPVLIGLGETSDFSRLLMVTRTMVFSVIG
jgi:hypothetical protein